MSINKVMVTGNLTGDPELRQTAGGMQVLGMRVAVNDRRKNQQSGEWQDYPNFIDATLFGNRAASLAGYLSKGSKVAIEGKLRWSEWEDRNGGGKRSKIEIIVDEIEFMSAQNGQQAPRPAPAQPQYQQPQPAPQRAPQQRYAQQQQMPMQYQQPMAQQPIPQPAPQAVYADDDIPF